MSDSNVWAKTVLQEIDDRGEGLTEYEVAAVESFRRVLDENRFLSAKQEDLLARIHDDPVS